MKTIHHFLFKCGAWHLVKWSDIVTTTIGFVLLTHNKPEQAIRLVNRLSFMFDQPPIVWHHDLSQCPLPYGNISENVTLVRPSIKTGWGKFSVVDAAMKALETLYSTSSPDWWILLSGADYPIKPAKTIINDLTSRSFDVYLNYERLDYRDRRQWHRKCYDYYCSVKLFSIPTIKVPELSRMPTIRMKRLHLRHPYLISYLGKTPFSSEFPCYAGEHWFATNSRAAKYLITYHHEHPQLTSHYRRRDKHTIIPEESYYHTIFCNSSLKVSGNYWRYVDWSTGGAHPKTLRMEDLPKIMESNAHFARKFDPDIDSEVLDFLDEYISA